MSYLVQAQLASDNHVTQRVAACAAAEGISDPYKWASAHGWELSSQPGWVEAYADGGPNPGENENAVTDAMILAAVRTLTESPTE